MIKKNFFFMIGMAVLLDVSTADAQSLTKIEAEKAKAEICREWTTATKEKYQKEWNEKIVRVDSLMMPFVVRTYDEKPADGYSLYISLHGGGNCPKEINDQQWMNQVVLYRPKNCLYIAPRAPYNDWDMWCKPKLDQFYKELIEMCVVYADVNPDKVYLMGYSAGGDGVWRMAPRMADHWAAASMMAGHPGDVSLVNLRNMPYMIWCGALDYAYDRNKLDRERGVQMDSLQHADPEGYIHETHIMEGKGHWMDRADTLAVSWMSKYQRNPYPKKIVWSQEEVLRPAFYWISVPKEEMQRGKTIRLSADKNIIDITECDYREVTLLLSDEIVDLDKKVTIRYQGKKLFKGKLKRTAQTLRQTMQERGDYRYAFPAKVTVKITK